MTKPHSHHWMIRVIDDIATGTCSARGCPVKVRTFRDHREPVQMYSWNAAGFNAGIHLPLPRMRDDEGYD